MPLKEEGNLETKRDTHSERIACNERERDWGDVATNQQTPNTGNCQELG